MSECEIKLSVEDVRKTYDTSGFSFEVLRGVSFQVYEGEFCIITGPSGSGKTTILNLIGILDEPTEGHIIIDGIDVTRLSGVEKDKFRNKKIGFIFQFFNLINELTVLENVMLPALISGLGSKQSRDEAVNLLKAVGLESKINNPAIQLSGGEMQRVSIARALINKPALILADEPTGNLDSKNTAEIMRLLKELNQQNKQSFIVVTHDPRIVQAATKVIDILDGQVREVIHRTEFFCPYRKLTPHPS